MNNNNNNILFKFLEESLDLKEFIVFFKIFFVKEGGIIVLENDFK